MFEGRVDGLAVDHQNLIHYFMQVTFSEDYRNYRLTAYDEGSPYSSDDEIQMRIYVSRPTSAGSWFDMYLSPHV